MNSDTPHILQFSGATLLAQQINLGRTQDVLIYTQQNTSVGLCTWVHGGSSVVHQSAI